MELNTKYMGHNIKYFDEINSTNVYAKQLIKEVKPPEGTLIWSDKQLQGKGRLGRTWASAANVGIWMSLILYPKLEPEKISPLTLVAGLAMCQSLREISGLNIKLKWPNDLVVNGKKICGILSEMIMLAEQEVAVVTGIGVNVNTKEFDTELAYATSLLLETGKQFNREVIISKFLSQFECLYEVYNKEGTFLSLRHEYENLCVNMDADVCIHIGDEKFLAKAVSLSDNGNLCVRYEDGRLEEVSSGEVSVRGVGNYV